MGLDAIVYKNARSLREKHGSAVFDFDEFTGELSPKLNVKVEEPRSSYIALEKRIGNFDAVGHLRSKISEIVDEESVVLRKVLYSATHAGDKIDIGDFSKLKQEIATVRSNTADPAVIAFIYQMEELVNAASTENNPIVFT